MLILFRWFREKPADLDLQCFQRQINPGSAGQGINKQIEQQIEIHVEIMQDFFFIEIKAIKEPKLLYI